MSATSIRDYDWKGYEAPPPLFVDALDDLVTAEIQFKEGKADLRELNIKRAGVRHAYFAGQEYAKKLNELGRDVLAWAERVDAACMDIEAIATVLNAAAKDKGEGIAAFVSNPDQSDSVKRLVDRYASVVTEQLTAASRAAAAIRNHSKAITVRANAAIGGAE